MDELDRERMLRVDAEHRLRDVTSENDSYRGRLQTLKEELRR